MALFKEVKCGRCDRRYSALRSRCPHCGARKNRDGKASTVESGTRWQVIVGAVVLLAIIAAAIILITTSLKNKEPEPGGSTKAPASAPPTPTPTPEPVVNSITLSRSDFTLSHIGEQYTIQATISPAGTKVNIVWISEDPDVATVDENGTVTAVDHGTTKVSATAGGVIQECIVRVSAYAPHDSSNGGNSSGNGSVSLSHYDVTIHSAKSETFKLSVKGAGDNAVISYSSGNSSVASVTSDGTVKAVGNGNTDITVTITVNGETLELKCKVYVVN